uniref:Reverse transcriptase domain-containing protein n=1 Tax=Cyprinus carpio carpio TaxID=630221 RepID=A0A9J7XM44_CYPCA
MCKGTQKYMDAVLGGSKNRTAGARSNASFTSPRTVTSRTCFRCGSDKHLANAVECPAAKVICKICKKKGHFARVCRSTQTHTVHEVLMPEYTLLLLQESDVSAKLHCTVQVEAGAVQRPVTLTVDTGASVSVLPKSMYDDYFGEVPLQPPAACLVTYSRTPIHVIGCLHATVVKDCRKCSVNFYVVDKGTALMGMDLIRALNLCIKGDTILPDHATTSTFHSSEPVLQLSTQVDTPSVGCVEGFMHKVKVSDSVMPVRQKLRRLPFSVRKAVSAELDRLLLAGVIERIDASPWVSPIVVTMKKTGGIRMCVDLREPNKAVIIDSYPLPHMEELLTALAGSTMFSTIDLESAYHQVPLHPESRDLTAFITHEGLFRFCRVPYGLASAPSVFQKMMECILKGVPNVQNYLDDVICFGRTAAEHDIALNTVLSRLKEAGLRLNEQKCQIRQKSLRFLGHSVTAQGVQPDTEHLQAIVQAPAPKDASSLRSFLGMLSWYNKFIPNYATVVEPLRACLRQEGPFQWSEETENCFVTLKKLLVASPALALYDPNLPSIISTDASDYGLGAVFTQIHPDNTERTVAFASRSLTQTERKYATVEKEALACVWAVEKWRTYLWGRKFTLRTDHQALTTLLCTKGADRAGMRIARWAARLLCFNYDVVYRAGLLNCTADCLSRKRYDHSLPPRCLSMCAHYFPAGL